MHFTWKKLKCFFNTIDNNSNNNNNDNNDNNAHIIFLKDDNFI